MYSLNVIKSLNRRDPIVPESEVTRHCSYVENKRAQTIVLHSAKHRSTLAIQGAVNCRNFLLKVLSTNSVDRVDRIIESYFDANLRPEVRGKLVA